MKISLSWLSELVEVPGDPAVLAGRLAMLGLPVESITHVGGQFSGVVVAEVRKKAPHPKADKLTVVTVWDGQGSHEVVCGAPNVPAPGGKVLWARPGARLPGGVEIGEKALRGVHSVGMICSEAELGLSDDHAGIIVLSDEDARAPTGQAAQAALGLDDVILDVEITPNRGDCLSHLGIARELGAIYQQPVKVPSHDVAPFLADADEAPVGVRIEDPDCRRYVARVVLGLAVKPSPRWMRRRLEAVGVRPISNLVDITNYVMFELGQPLHAFDRAALRGPAITVRSARAGERLTTLDGQERVLETSDLLICDGAEPVALAGVMGGAGSEVTGATRDVLIESAAFSPKRVRRTARRLGLHSESSQRFERGVDPSGQDRAAARAARLLCELGGGRVARAMTDENPRPFAAVSIELRPARLAALLGVEVPVERMTTLLGAVGVSATPKPAAGGDVLACAPPAHRPDLELEVDLIEEVARLHGYEHIPATLPATQRSPAATTDVVAERIHEALIGAGLSEAITYGFTAPARIAALRLPEGHPVRRPIALKNPLGEEQSVMRTSLMANLLAALARNLAHGEHDVRLFELGSVFLPSGQVLPAEVRHVAGVMCGERPGWLVPEGPIDFFDARGVVERLLAAVGLSAELQPARSEDGFLHPGVGAAIVCAGEHVGVVGEVHPETRDAFGIAVPVMAFELNLDRLPPLSRPRYRGVSRFPASARDVSFFVRDDVPAARVRQVLTEAREPLLADIAVREDYREPGKVPAGQKGMLWSLTYRAEDRTLTDAEVDGAHERLVKTLIEAVGGVRR
jgi:phenylalanyl-tRNA synthetase beta chain